ncbi:MAG: EcsC family protein [bacterium]|nr:EcsC family protein [bacterium]
MKKRLSPYEKELQKLQRQESMFFSKYSEKDESKLNRLIEDKVPDKVQSTLEKAFVKAFTYVFEKGTALIEKTYKKDGILEDFDVNLYAANRKNTKKEWKAFAKRSTGSANKNLLVTGASGVGLGLLGIGIPDIVLFLSLQLRSIYEIALHYGYTYEKEQEQRLILLLICGAISYGEEQKAIDDEINHFIENGTYTSQKELNLCIAEAASCLSKELLYMKFLQSIPVVGAVGGMFDAIYMKRINKYAELKYRRRFLHGCNDKYVIEP